ncbi:MAG TPA: P22 phage major capsid protein family protein [Lacunisphaera sp.]
MADVAVYTDLVAQTGVDALISEEPVLQIMDKSIAKEYEQKKYQTGDTVRIRIEDQPKMPTQSNVLNLDPIVQSQIDVTVLQWNTGFEMSGLEEAYYLGGEERVKSKILIPRLKTMATQAAVLCYDELCTCPGFFGTPGTAPKSATDWGYGQAALDDQLAGGTGYYAIMDNLTMVETAGDLATRFNPTTDSATAYMKGRVQMAMNMSFFQTSNLPTHTNGTAVGNGTSGMVIASAPATGATSISVSGGTANGTITENSVISIAGVYEIQPHTKRTLPRLRTFTVTSTATLNGSGAGTINVFPAIYGPENPKLQTCSALPAITTGFVKVYGEASATYQQGLVMKKNSATFVGLSLPDLVMQKVSVADYEGVEVKASAGSDFVNYINQVRADILVAAKIRQWRHQYRYFARRIG